MRSLPKTDRVALLGCLAAGLAVRLVWIGRDDLWSDEVHTLRTVSLPFAEVAGERLRAGHVPLYFLLLRGWTALFGDSQTALRVPSALLGAGLLVPSFALLRRLVPASAARWGLLLLALHPTFVELSREARMYPLLGLAFAVAAEAAVAGLDEGRLPARFWAAVAVGPLVHPSWAFAAVPLAVWLAVEARRAASADPSPSAGDRARAGRRAAAGLAASVAVLVLLLAWATPQHQLLTRRPWERELLVFLVRPLVGSDLRPDLTNILLLTLAGWAVCLWRGSREPAARARRFALAVGVGVPLASVASGVIGGLPWGPVRYVHLGALGLTVLACLAAEHSRRVGDEARGLAASGRDQASPAESPGARSFLQALRRDWIGVPWLGAAMLVLLASRTAWPRTAWSDAAREAETRVPAGETLWVDDEGSAVVLSHYLGRAVSPGAPAPPQPHWRVAVDARTSLPAWQVLRVER